jgi:CheY-like chemotaxis protein
MDDELSIRRLGTSILNRLGYEVSVVSNGEDAVREYAQGLKSGRPYAAVILDLTVPGGMGGLQAMEELRKIDSDVRAIVSSGYSNDAVLSNHRAYGFRGIAAKPYAADDIARAVEQVLRDKGA